MSSMNREERMNANSLKNYLTTGVSSSVAVAGKEVQKVGWPMTHDDALRHNTEAIELLLFELGDIKVVIILIHLMYRNSEDSNHSAILPKIKQLLSNLPTHFSLVKVKAQVSHSFS